MKLLNENFNYDIGYKSFIDEFDSFDEFDLEWISRDYDEKSKPIILMKDIDGNLESIY